MSNWKDLGYPSRAAELEDLLRGEREAAEFYRKCLKTCRDKIEELQADNKWLKERLERLSAIYQDGGA